MKKMIVPAIMAMLAAFAMPMAATAQDQKPLDGFSWKCAPTGRNSMQCQFKNVGVEPAGMCMEVVKVCKSGDHSAYVCTGPMSPGDTEQRVVTNFDPKVKFFEPCMGVEYRNKKLDK